MNLFLSVFYLNILSIHAKIRFPQKVFFFLEGYIRFSLGTDFSLKYGTHKVELFLVAEYYCSIWWQKAAVRLHNPKNSMNTNLLHFSFLLSLKYFRQHSFECVRLLKLLCYRCQFSFFSHTNVR